MSQLFVILVSYVFSTVAVGSLYAWLGGQFNKQNYDRHPGRAYGVAAISGAAGVAMSFLPIPIIARLLAGGALTTALLMIMLRMSFFHALGTQILGGLILLGVGLMIAIIMGLGSAGIAIAVGVSALIGLVALVRSAQKKQLKAAFDAIE